jgi:hypothetical protein
MSIAKVLKKTMRQELQAPSNKAKSKIAKTFQKLNLKELINMK